MNALDREAYPSLAAYVAAIDAAVRGLGHIFTAFQVVKELRQLGEGAHVEKASESSLASVIILGYDCVFHVGDGGWSTVLHTPAPADRSLDADGAVNDLPATAPAADVAAAIVAHLKAHGQ